MRTTELNYITELHQDHREWIKELAFYEDELKIMRGQLAELSAKNSAQEVKMEVEKFQNQFIIQQNELDTLKHLVNRNEDLLEKEVKANPVAVEHRKVVDDSQLRDQMEQFEKLFKEMKEDFLDFARKNF